MKTIITSRIDERGSFFGEQALYDAFLARITAHTVADEIIQGTYWERGKGCLIGCSVHSNNALAFERVLALPVALARIGEALFERLPNEEAKTLPLEFAHALGAPGRRYDHVLLAFLLAALDETRAARRVPEIDRMRRIMLVWLHRGYVDRTAAANAANAAYAAANAAYAAAAFAANANDAYAAANAAANAAVAYAANAAAANANDANDAKLGVLRRLRHRFISLIEEAGAEQAEHAARLIVRRDRERGLRLGMPTIPRNVARPENAARRTRQIHEA